MIAYPEYITVIANRGAPEQTPIAKREHPDQQSLSVGDMRTALGAQVQSANQWSRLMVRKG